jgi:SAM-dependent methyltransferase
MNWRVKGVIQNALSAIPHGTGVNDLLQRTWGGLRNFDRQVAGKVEDWSIFADHLAKLSIRPQGVRFVEIGTGWFPTLPLCFSLAGAEVCETFDLNRHLSPHLTAKLLTALRSHLQTVATYASRPLGEVERCYQELAGAASLAEVLGRARVQYHAPADATRTPIPDGSVDVVFSNSVLEHVPGGVIRAMFRESKRVLRQDGVMIHCVNCGDHYAYFDRSITAINYLTYSEYQWRRWNNDLQYQNRLRPIDFVKMAEEEGLEVVLNCYRPREDLKAALPGLRIADEFRGYAPEQLCSTSVAFAATKV